MRVVTAEEIHSLDIYAIEKLNIPGSVLMENAGRAVAEVIVKNIVSVIGGRVAVFCGSGNNGGDGFVAARYLMRAGALPFVVMCGNESSLKADARLHFELLKQLHIPVITPDDPNLMSYCNDSSLVIDALLGTGSKGAPRSHYAEIIRIIENLDRPIVSIDIPSGVDPDTGQTPGVAVIADHTVCLVYPKRGMFLFPGAEHCGTIYMSDLGLPWDQFPLPSSMRLISVLPDRQLGPAWLSDRDKVDISLPSLIPLLAGRASDSNKGDYGHVGIVAGSRGMVGAAALASRAALRAGAGLVTALVPACIQPALAAKLDEAMTLPLPYSEGAVSEEAFERIFTFSKHSTLLCIGPGLSASIGTVALVQRLIKELECPLILDADGLNILAMRPEIALQREDDPRMPLILTPHPGEAARLLGTSVEWVESNRIEAVTALARKYRATALLKGSFTLIADNQDNILVNNTGNPGMATGGSGDVLLGILGGLMAQAFAPGRGIPDPAAWREAVIPAFDVTGMGVCLHGLAGDMASEKMGETCMIAGDIINFLPRALKKLRIGYEYLAE